MLIGFKCWKTIHILVDSFSVWFSLRYFSQMKHFWTILSDRNIWRPTHFKSGSCCLRCKWCSNKDVSRRPIWYVYELTARIVRVFYKINTHLPRSQFNKRTVFFDVVTTKTRIRNTFKRKSRVKEKYNEKKIEWKMKIVRVKKKLRDFVWNRHKIKSNRKTKWKWKRKRRDIVFFEMSVVCLFQFK